jgi:hypothetical protein
MASAAGFAPAIFCLKDRRVDWTTPRGRKLALRVRLALTTSTFAGWRSIYLNYRSKIGAGERINWRMRRESHPRRFSSRSRFRIGVLVYAGPHPKIGGEPWSCSTSQ